MRATDGRLADQARALETAGRPLQALEAWRRAAAQDPSDAEAAQHVLALVAKLSAKGPISPETATQLAQLRTAAEGEPGRAERWKRLVGACAEAGDLVGQIEALRRLEPLVHAVWAHKALARLLVEVGEETAAIPHLTVVTQARPDDLVSLKRLARALTAEGDLDAASAAWRRVEQLLPGDMEVEEGLARVASRRARSPVARAPRLRVAIVGNCQALCISRSLRSLRPDLEVQGLFWNALVTPAAAERAAREIQDFDVVVTQGKEDPGLSALSIRALRDRATRVALLPPIYWTGLHPDVVCMPAGRLANRAAPFRDYHSAIVLAAFLMGLSERDAADLFNAYIYARLGYFDEDAKSELFLLGKARVMGLDLAPAIAEWRRAGAFMHTPNHPGIAVVTSLAEILCDVLALGRPETPPPLADPMLSGVVWPVYPEIARRQGLEGSLLFKQGGADTRPVDLGEMIALSYAAYAKADPGQLRIERIGQTIAALRAEGV
jgi:tetratricopeptide (TPR) repeat protein